MDLVSRMEIVAEFMDAFDALASCDRSAVASAAMIALCDGWYAADYVIDVLGGLLGLVESFARFDEGG